MQRLLEESVKKACEVSFDQLDQQSAQAVLDGHKKWQPGLTALLVETVLHSTVSDKYKDEEVPSKRVYPATYHLRPIEAQVTELRKCFPKLGDCAEKLARRSLPNDAEGWFAIPRWQALAPTYNEAVEIVIKTLAEKRRFSDRIAGKLSEKYLRQCERSRLAQQVLCEQQEGNDILVVGAQFGLLHRGASARRTRVALAGNEFCLGIYAIACMLLTHPERLSSSETLMIDCGGDEYSAHGDYVFDRVPLFDYDISGIEFSIFYEDRARNLWGTPTGFLFRFD